jgi:hypothetical protein
MSNETDEIVIIINEMIDQIDEDIALKTTCDQCSMRERNSQADKQPADDHTTAISLCNDCSRQRDEEAEKVLADLQSLANEVEQRLEAIENTERELDQWRDAQLQENRHFWDGENHIRTTNVAFVHLVPIRRISSSSREFLGMPYSNVAI